MFSFQIEESYNSDSRNNDSKADGNNNGKTRGRAPLLPCLSTKVGLSLCLAVVVVATSVVVTVTVTIATRFLLFHLDDVDGVTVPNLEPHQCQPLRCRPSSHAVIRRQQLQQNVPDEKKKGGWKIK